MTLATRIRRYAGPIQWLSLLLILVALVMTVRALPVSRGIDALTTWVEGLGVWGPFAFGLSYIVAALLFVPGSALTLAGGAVFGLFWGTLTVSLASTTAAGVAFLIARYLARNKVADLARRNPKFDAIDRAIGEGGWKMIVMLRLSPAVPFSLSNYLYGLTAVRFWPCVLASWVAMLPGTFLYVYIGNVGREGLQAAGGSHAGRTPGQWAMLIVGLLATAAVTVYITRLARKALKEKTRIDEVGGESAPQGPAHHECNAPTEATTWPWGTTVTALVAVLMVSTAACAHLKQDVIRGLFGPPVVTLVEAYSQNKSGPAFDHSAFDELLHKHVSRDGWVDYRGLQGDAEELDHYIESLAKAPFDAMDRNQKLALLINAYNAFTLRLILDFKSIQSIMDIPPAKRWDARRWRLGGHTWSLNQIEHEQIRPKFREPRVHFALVCAAVGCPKLRNEAYSADRIEDQLEDQAKYIHSHDRWFRFSSDEGVVHLTRLYKWYRTDFEQVGGSVLKFAARYSPALKKAIETGHKPKIRWLKYDWKLNSKENAP